jgi:hypothetical protein
MGTKRFDNLPKVKFGDIANQLQQCDILFISGSSLISKAIELNTSSIFSHIALIVIWEDKVLLLESIEDDGIHALPFSQYLNNYDNSGKPYDGRLFIGRYNPLAPTDKAKILDRSVDYLNKKYDDETYLKLISRLILPLAKYTDNGTYTCSEYIGICYNAAGIEFNTNSGGFIFPEHIAADEHITPLWEIEL